MVLLEDASSPLALTVSPRSGGELCGLRVRRGGRPVELIYRARRGWRGGAPWLFPAVGRSRVGGNAGFWKFTGKIRPMPLHGFVSGRPWTLVGADPRRALCVFRSDRVSRAAYPFDFELSAEYVLEGNAAVARARVRASPRNAGPMPFSIGNHLTLSLKAFPGCRVRTPAREILALTPGGFLSGAVSPARLSRGAALAARPALSDLVLGDCAPGRSWCEVSGGGLTLRVSQRELPRKGKRPLARPEDFRFVFYSDRKTFFCPEPWLGEPDSLNTGAGLLRLPPGEGFGWELRLELL